MSFIKKNCSFKISSLFGGYLWIYPVNIIEQPHGSDQCGYIHLLYRFIFWFTVVEVGDLCRLGWSIKDQMTGPFKEKPITFRCNPEFLKSRVLIIPHSNKSFNSWRHFWTHHMNPVQPHLTLTNCSKIFLQDLAHFDFHTSYFILYN